jgi:kynurenine formamidase
MGRVEEHIRNGAPGPEGIPLELCYGDGVVLVMVDHDYWHLENLTNLDKIGSSQGFKLSCFPIKWTGTTAAPVRAVAIVDD